jgi:hypothetical protein
MPGARKLSADLSSYVAKSLFSVAHTILTANTASTPDDLLVDEQTLVGRLTGGNIAALTVPQVRTLLTLDNYHAICGTNAGQTIPNNAYTIVNYETETLNADECVVVGASWAYTVPVGGDGSYFVKASILFAPSTAWTAGEIARLRVNVSDSATLWYLDSKANEGSTSHTVMLRGCEDIPLVAGDTISIEVFQNTGGNLDLTTSPGFCNVSIRRTEALSA